MKNSSNSILSFLLMSALLISCNDDRGGDPAPEEAYFQLADYFERNNEKDMQRLTFDPTDSVVNMGEQGTMVSFPANSLLDSNGDTVKGQCTLELLEIYSKADMVRNGVLSVDVDGIPLISGGEVIMNIYRGEEKLKVVSGVDGRLGFASPAGTVLPNSTLYLSSNAPASQCITVPGPFSIPWENTFFPFGSGPGTGVFFDRFGNIANPFSGGNNVDAPAPAFKSPTSGKGGQKTTNFRFLNITVSSKFARENLMVMGALANENSTFPICAHPLDSLEDYYRYRSRDILLNEKLTIYCMAEKDGKLYADFIEHTVVNSNILALRPQLMTEQEFEDRLEGL